MAICGLGASLPLQDSTGISPVTAAFQRKVQVPLSCICKHKEMRTMLLIIGGV